MSNPYFTSVLHELEGIIEKRAATQSKLDTDGGGYGSDAAGPTGSAQTHAQKTKGGGKPAEVKPNESGPDGAAPNKVNATQRAGERVDRYNVGMGGEGGAETAPKDGPNSDAEKSDDKVATQYDDNPLSEGKSAEMANNILRGLSALVRNGSGGQTMKQAGSDQAEKVLQRLIQRELRKMAMGDMEPEELARKWPSLSEEEKKHYMEAYPELVEEAMALRNMDEGGGEAGGGDDKDYEKMSAAERAEYEYYKQAGAQAALQYVQQMMGAAQQQPQHDLQKQAALRDYEQSRLAGRQAAERDIQALIQKQAAAAYQAGQRAALSSSQQSQARQQQQQHTKSAQVPHPMNSPDPQEAYNEMLKYAKAANINPDVLHEMLTEVYQAARQDGGTPHPFGSRGHVKNAVDVAPLYPVLSGLLDEGTISSEEKEAILNYLAGVEDLSEDALLTAVKDTRRPQEVLKRILAGDVQQHQRNTHKAPSPKPSMPATQPSPAAETAEESRTVSEGGEEEEIPGSVEETAPDEHQPLITPLIVEAALRSELKRLDPERYKSL